MNNPLIQIPEQFRASHPILLQKIGKFFLTITGWKFKGDIPRSDRIILVAGPHTSNWDFLLALAFIFGLNLNVFWIGKHTLFKNGFSKIMRKLGGIPVDRASPELLMNEVSHIVKKQQGVIIAISPEGTRKKVERLKSGFLRIAKTTNSQILLAGIDFESKLIHLGKLFEPSGNTESDLLNVHNYFRQFKGKRPEFS
ncbi:MAG: 1-acyl-sn-glycerol-3-phosphate acyltransferase [Gammaproteobacteria bacterium]|nr:1-acyl-sn-glycerol-3-phosphate acyltransferase [Gammaproteobacteria bacterium]